MTKQTKLSKVQENALRTMIINEWRRIKLAKTNWQSSAYCSIVNATFQALTKKGVVEFVPENFEWQLTEAGRKVAIDLLIELARKEMEEAFEHREQEEKRKKAARDIKTTIMKTYCLHDWEVGVIASCRFRNMQLRYSVDLAQKRSKRAISDLVSIGWTHDEYTVDTTGTSLNAKDAKRMSELMLIAVKIIESGILINGLPDPTPPAPELTDEQAEMLEQMGKRQFGPRFGWGDKAEAILSGLSDLGYSNRSGVVTQITPAGHAALKAHQVSKEAPVVARTICTCEICHNKEGKSPC